MEEFFAIYNDEESVGFMMLDEDLEERCLVIWHIMFPPEQQWRDCVEVKFAVDREKKFYE